VCHFLLQDPKFFQLLVRIDEEFARACHAGGCSCGGVLHRGDYPRKPRGCPRRVRELFESRFSFCCSRCRKRTTSASVRFLGRRVYLALVVVLRCSQTSRHNATDSRLSYLLDVSVRTLARWRRWWQEGFPLTPLWQAECARLMPPVVLSDLPGGLLERFEGKAAESLLRMLVFLHPLTRSLIMHREAR
jgi:hypothetical protein